MSIQKVHHDVKDAMVEKLMEEKVMCSRAVKLWATEWCADMGRVAVELLV